MKALRELAAIAWPFPWPLSWFQREKPHRRSHLYFFMCWVVRVGTRALCRLDIAELERVARQGPVILVSNHVTSLEVPLLFAHLQPRRMIGLAKTETWDSRFMGWLFTLWEAIPVRRGEADLDAMRRCLDVLKSNGILAIAPEGTRSRHGRLLRGQPGIVTLALRTGAPIQAIAHWGGEAFGSNLKRLKRTDFRVRVGQPFYLDAHGEKVTGEVRQAMVDEIMCRVAELLPEAYHGEYAEAVEQPAKYIRYESAIK
jgi:1-acyl-sn-glycerol-3-phosphate acyltransferase